MGKILGEYVNEVINMTLKIRARTFNPTLVMLIKNNHSIKAEPKERKFEFSINRRQFRVIPKCLLISDDSQPTYGRPVIERLSAFLILALLL